MCGRIKAKIARYMRRFFSIMHFVFQDVRKPSFHDSFHMVQQIKEVIAPAHSNCKISESFHHIERVATGESNNKAPEVEISKASWRDHLCQCLANGFFFYIEEF